MTLEGTEVALPLWALVLLAGVPPLVTLIGGSLFGLFLNRKKHEYDLNRLRQEAELARVRDAEAHHREMEAEHKATRTAREETAREELTSALLPLGAALVKADLEKIEAATDTVSRTLWKYLPDLPDPVRDDMLLFVACMNDALEVVDAWKKQLTGETRPIASTVEELAIRAMREAISTLGAYIRMWRIGQDLSDLPSPAFRKYSTNIPRSLQGALEGAFKAAFEIAKAKGVNTDEIEASVAEAHLAGLGTAGQALVVMSEVNNGDFGDKLRAVLKESVTKKPKATVETARAKELSTDAPITVELPGQASSSEE